MRALVTGCAGFVGWKVCERLARDGHQVVGLDNLVGTHDIRLKEWRVEQLRALPAFRFYCGDVEERDELQRLCRDHGIEAVVNLAARTGVRQSLLDPWAYYATNVVGTLNVLDCCRELGIGKLVLASTSSVYAGGERPFREDQPTDRPLSPYAASKKAAEELCYAYHNSHGIDVTVLRYFTVYGPAGRPDMAVFRFVRWIAEGEPLVLYGDGSQERDFTYVDDVAAGTALALRPAGYRVINLGSDRPVPVREVIALLEELLGRRARVERRPPHPADAPATWADITRARRELGWAPAMPLAEGLARAVEWYQQNRAWASLIDVGEAPSR
jgi:UDP-glucuronate 4-epimerase